MLEGVVWPRGRQIPTRRGIFGEVGIQGKVNIDKCELVLYNFFDVRCQARHG